MRVIVLKPTYHVPVLPLTLDIETRGVLRSAAQAHRFLAEVKGLGVSIPNQGILIDTLILQEARASSAIENIVTTHDELFQADLFPGGPASGAAKEVARYRDALRCGYEQVRKIGLITNNTIIDMFRLLKGTDEGFRSTPGTALKHEATGEIIYVPPQDGSQIQGFMDNLEKFINDDAVSKLDPLVKMAIVHHQFESIHPFSDGNGRIGRILNVLYLTRVSLLDIPTLYLSRGITQTKSDYYKLLQHVREEDGSAEAWERWIIYMLDSISSTAKTTIELIEGLRNLMSDYKKRIRHDMPNIYTQDLLNNLFRHPYTRIEFLQKDLGITRQTAAKYLDSLAASGFLHKQHAGRNNYYINTPLVSLFMRVSSSR